MKQYSTATTNSDLTSTAYTAGLRVEIDQLHVRVRGRSRILASLRSSRRLYNQTQNRSFTSFLYASFYHFQLILVLETPIYHRVHGSQFHCDPKQGSALNLNPVNRK